MTNSRYDILAVDLDGTLLGADGAVSDRNRRAVAAARAAGIEVIIATGRALVESRHILHAIGYDGLFIGAGGAMLCDARTGATIRRSVMEHGLISRIVGSLQRHGHLAHVLKDGSCTGYDYLIVGDGELDRATRWWFDTLPVRARYAPSLEGDLHPHETLRCGTVAAAGELQRVVDELRSDLGKRIFLQHWAAVTEAHAINAATHMLEVFNPDVDKWTMLRDHAASRGVPVERVAAIGDGINDVRMIRESGLGVAMGNADQSVLDVADRVVVGHEEDGVAHAIMAILEARW